MTNVPNDATSNEKTIISFAANVFKMLIWLPHLHKVNLQFFLQPNNICCSGIAFQIAFTFQTTISVNNLLCNDMLGWIQYCDFISTFVLVVVFHILRKWFLCINSLILRNFTN